MKTKNLSRQFATVLAILMLAGSSLAVAGRGEIRARARLVAPQAAGDISGKADFRQRGSARRQFSVEVEGLAPGDKYDVAVAGKIVGTVNIDDLGVGELGYDDTAGPLDADLPFPSGFPKINGGENVVVGPLSGTFQAK